MNLCLSVYHYYGSFSPKRLFCKHSLDRLKSLFSSFLPCCVHSLLCRGYTLCYGNDSNFQQLFENAPTHTQQTLLWKSKRLNMRVHARPQAHTPLQIWLIVCPWHFYVFDERRVWKGHMFKSQIFKCGVVFLFPLMRATQGTPVLGWTCC